MRRLKLIYALLLIPAVCQAGSLADSFGAGVLGIPWGYTFDQLVGVHPDGDNVFSTAPGNRSYWVKDGETYLGVPRDRQGALYGLDEQDHVVIVSVAFAYERREELQSVLQSLLGVPRYAPGSSKNQRWYFWPSDAGMHVSVHEYAEPRHAIIWLVVTGPEYKRESSTCPPVRR